MAHIMRVLQISGFNNIGDLADVIRIALYKSNGTVEHAKCKNLLNALRFAKERICIEDSRGYYIYDAIVIAHADRRYIINI